MKISVETFKILVGRCKDLLISILGTLKSVNDYLVLIGLTVNYYLVLIGLSCLECYTSKRNETYTSKLGPPPTTGEMLWQRCQGKQQKKVTLPHSAAAPKNHPALKLPALIMKANMFWIKDKNK